MTAARAEVVGFTTANAGIVAILAYLAYVNPVLRTALDDPAGVVPAVAVAVAFTVAASWLRFGQLLLGRGDARSLVEHVEHSIDFLPAVGLAGTILGLTVVAMRGATGEALAPAAIMAMRSTLLGVLGFALVRRNAYWLHCVARKVGAA